jgi:intergrase/recombinase
VGPAGFEPATSSAREEFNESNCAKTAGFDAYLSKVLTSHKDRTYLNTVAKKYKHVLETGNASVLLSLTHNVRRNAMRALSHLAKYNGVYEQWQKIIKNHGIHWRETNNDTFDFFDKETISEMIEYVKQTMKILPPDMANTFVTATILGLRADEACKAISLLKQNTQDYYNEKLGVLEHYKHKTIFIRRTKKAYISLVDTDLLALAKQSCESYQAIRSYLKRRKTPMQMKYCRKIFGTYLRQNGIESEFIDVLQGRVPQSVFAKHYYRPDQATTDKARTLIAELKTKLL